MALQKHAPSSQSLDTVSPSHPLSNTNGILSRYCGETLALARSRCATTACAHNARPEAAHAATAPDATCVRQQSERFLSLELRYVSSLADSDTTEEFQTLHRRRVHVGSPEHSPSSPLEPRHHSLNRGLPNTKRRILILWLRHRDATAHASRTHAALLERAKSSSDHSGHTRPPCAATTRAPHSSPSVAAACQC